MQHVSTCDSHHQASKNHWTFHRFYFVHLGIPYALHRIILWGNLSTNTLACNVRHVVWAMLFAGRWFSTSWLSAGLGGFFLLFHSLTLLPVSAHSIGSVFIFLLEKTVCRQQYLFDKCLLLYVLSWTPDGGRNDRPKHAECHSKIK